MSDRPSPATAAGGDPLPDALAETADGSNQPVSVQERSAELPHRIDRFVVLRKLGQGGMGVVYAAYDEELDRKVAVKLLHGAEMASAEHRTRILREAQAMARVSHPNVVHVYEVGEFRDQVYIAMELVEGSTLDVWQRQPGRRWEEIVQMYIAAGQGLLAAHKVGLIHRDFKPENVLFGDGRPRVADFGLARAQGATESSATPLPSSPNQLLASSVTAAGALVGTPAYMSPEQYSGELLDARSDQFSFCAALYEALYRQLPFEGKNLADLAGNIVLAKVRAVPKESPVPSIIDQVLRRGLARSPEQRFPSMAELLAALYIDPRHDPAGEPQSRRGFLRIFMGGVAILMAGLVGRHVLRSSAEEVRVTELVAAAGFMLLVVLAAGFGLRRSLLRNSFHRGMARLVLLMAIQLVSVRLIALMSGMTVHQTIAIDFAALVSIGILACWDYIPLAWPMPVFCIPVGIIVARNQDVAITLGTLFLPAFAVLMISAWNRSVRRRARGQEHS